MRLFTGWVMAAGLVFASAAANAQVRAPYSLASDIDGPYAGARGSYAAVLPAVKDGGTVTVPVVTIYRERDGEIADYRIFIDLAPLFA